jgi:hypothetical protein
MHVRPAYAASPCREARRASRMSGKATIRNRRQPRHQRQHTARRRGPGQLRSLAQRSTGAGSRSGRRGRDRPARPRHPRFGGHGEPKIIRWWYLTAHVCVTMVNGHHPAREDPGGDRITGRHSGPRNTTRNALVPHCPLWNPRIRRTAWPARALARRNRPDHLAEPLIVAGRRRRPAPSRRTPSLRQRTPEPQLTTGNDSRARSAGHHHKSTPTTREDAR